MRDLKRASLLIIAIITLVGIQLTQLEPIVAGQGQKNIESTLTEAIDFVTISTVFQDQSTRVYINAENTAALFAPNTRFEASTPEGDLTANTNTEFLALDNSLPRIIPNDPYFDRQWAINIIGVPEMWHTTEGKPNVLVAVLDSGIDDNHPELEGKLAANIDLTGSMTPDDVYGHGTHIAGIIAAERNNGIGITGIAPKCRLINVKVADDKGRSKASTVADAIIWATNNGANIINISVEFRQPFEDLEKAVNYAWNHGALVIAAAGNSGGQLPIYPAYYENCIAVAATRQDDTLAPLSNTGSWVDVAAPGFNIYSTMPQDRYDYKSGTSFAAAYVSGLAALLFGLAFDDNGNDRLNDEVRSVIELGCQPIGIEGIGDGRINAVNSYKILRAKSNMVSNELR